MRSPSTLCCSIIVVGVTLFAGAAVSSDSLLEKLTAENESLIEMRRGIAARMIALQSEKRQAESALGRIDADFQDARATLKSTGFVSTGLGQLLLEHRATLPDRKSLSDKIRARTDQIAHVGMRRILHRQELWRASQPDPSTIKSPSQPNMHPTPLATGAVRDAQLQRHSLLLNTVADDHLYLQTLEQVNELESQLLSSVTEYNEYLEQYLWWIRGSEPVRVKDIATLPAQLSALFSQTLESTGLSTDARQLLYSKTLWISIFISLLLQWKHRAIRRTIEATAENIGRVTQDHFSCTIRALVFTAIAALPLPLVLLAISWILRNGTNQPLAVDVSILGIALLLYALNFFRWTCMDKGLAQAHFKWPAESVRRLRSNLSRLTWVFIPTALLVSLTYTQNPTDTGGIVIRVGFLAFQLALSIFLYRLLHAKHGVLEHWLNEHKTTLLCRFYPAVFWFTVIIPAWLALEAMAGYGHSALAMSAMHLNTLGLIVVLVLVYAIAHRWLLLVSRKLAYAAAMERRKAMLAEREARSSGESIEESSELVIEEPVIDLNELSDNTRSVMMIAMIGLGLIGLFFIWSPSYPALRFFDTIDLWYQDVTVDGETKRLPTTVGDIGLAMLFLFGTVILVFRLPSVMEILLLQRPGVSESDRYTIKKLFTYTLTAVGALLALNAVGATWSQLQWLVAALGVGIGFGLQEIVANFISGLIILFERPVRIGDVVTVGETSGVVTKIRIRATTIRDWDRKELLVPNKDLITGRVINWSLSDEMTRIVITLGVAYSTDVGKAMHLMREAAEEHEFALDDPPPLLSFDSFGENALTLTMRVYVSAISHRIQTQTDLRTAINRKFNEAGITIAYPQLDVHLDTQERSRSGIDEVSEREKIISGSR